jgi:DNA-binding response OmpR family regulator
MRNTSVLVVDDDPKIRTLLRNCFEDEGYEIFEAGDAAAALDIIDQTKLDLITLDLHLGRDDGFEVARVVRKISQVPIIMLTGKDDVIDRIVGLEIGADDYITKPFHVREVLARVRSVLRRTAGQTDAVPDAVHKDNCKDAGSDAVRFDGLVAVQDRFELWDRNGRCCDLTSGDFKLLNVFLGHPKRILSRERLMDLIDGPGWAPLDRTIDNQVARLRKKIERDPADPKLIKTVRGIGYTLACDLEHLRNYVSEKTA